MLEVVKTVFRRNERINEIKYMHCLCVYFVFFLFVSDLHSLCFTGGKERLFFIICWWWCLFCLQSNLSSTFWLPWPLAFAPCIVYGLNSLLIQRSLPQVSHYNISLEDIKLRIGREDLSPSLLHQCLVSSIEDVKFACIMNPIVFH